MTKPGKWTGFVRRYSISIGLFIALVIGLSGYLANSLQGIRGSDDNLLFYMTGLNLFHAEKLESLNRRAVEFYKRNGASEHAVLRLNMHRNFLNEYVLPGAVIYGVSRSFKSVFDPVPDVYPLFLVQTFVFGLLFNFLIMLGLLLAAFAMIRRRLFVWALVATLALVALSNLLPMNHNSYATILWHKELGEMFTHLIELTLNPSPQFSSLSFPPRSNIALLLVGVFALRWTGRHFSAYLAAFFLSLVHLATSGLVLALMVAMDVVLRPGLFRRPQISAVIAVAAISMVIRESMFVLIVGEQALIAAAIIAAVILLAGLTIWFFKRSGTELSKLAGPYLRLRAWLIGRGNVAADLIVIAVLWISSLIVIYVLLNEFRAFSRWEAFYFWSRVNGRVLMVLHPTLIFGLCLLGFGSLVTRFANFRRHAATLMPALALVPMVILIGYAASIARSGNMMKTAVYDLFQAERYVQIEAMPQITSEKLKHLDFSDRVLYYAISKTVDGKIDALGKIMK